MKTATSLFVCLLLAGLAPAQTESAKPAPEMEKLIKMWAGQWSTVEIFEPSDQMPQGKQDKGAETMRSGPGRLSLIRDYESHGGPFGHLVVTWIPQEKTYKSYWTDRTQPGVSISTGKWDGDNLVFTSVDESTGKKLLTRDTYSEITRNSFTDTLETGPLGGPMKKILTVEYFREYDRTSQKDPCEKALTQMEMNACSLDQYRKADARLNFIYSNLLKSKEDDVAATQKLKDAEKAWIKYRDLHCEAAENEYLGGSMSPLIRFNCLTTVTNHRIDEIKAEYENGDKALE